MFARSKFHSLDDYFLNYTERPVKGYYFSRLVTYSPPGEEFLYKYLEAVKKCGVYIKGKIPNPDMKQLEYYTEIMGSQFRPDMSFLETSLGKWLPRLDKYQNRCIAEALMDTLKEMLQSGKNEMMLKNAYIKFMCWFYYKFERILTQLGKEQMPKILYEGDVSLYELKVLCILAKAGCDICLAQYHGDEEYLKVDPKSECSQKAEIGGGAFPPNYSVVQLESKMAGMAAEARQKKNPPPEAMQRGTPPSEARQRGTPPSGIRMEHPGRTQPKLEVPKPKLPLNTNAWLSGDFYDDVTRVVTSRGSRDLSICNMFVRLLGTENRGLYESELFKLKLKLESDRRGFVFAEKKIPVPDVGEIQAIPRMNYTGMNQMITHLSGYITFGKNTEIEKYAKAAFITLIAEDAQESIAKLTNRGVILLCWLKKYLPLLFDQYNGDKMPVFLYYGVCGSVNEAYFMRLLARMPVDVMIICPDLSCQCKLNDPLLYEKRYADGMPLGDFPVRPDAMKLGTVAFQAEEELNTLLYRETGIYRNRQFKKAIAVTLGTTYEEIKILWRQEAKYRPNFEILDDRVMLPVIFSKVSGVHGRKDAYWNEIAGLMDDETLVITELPYIKGIDYNPVKGNVTNFIRNGKLQIDKIKNHASYQYAFMREDMQDYLMDKLQQLLDMRLIKGTFTNGAEYTIVATALNLNKSLLRVIQKFDFTKITPKVIIVHTGDNVCSIEDSILTAYLNLCGFDIVIFTPTGYQSVERYFEQPVFMEYQVGEYMYEMQVPDLKALRNQKESLTDWLFRRGR